MFMFGIMLPDSMVTTADEVKGKGNRADNGDYPEQVPGERGCPVFAGAELRDEGPDVTGRYGVSHGIDL
jgi:hypothetical protein